MQKSTGGNQSENLFVTKRKSQLTKQARVRLIRKEIDSYFHAAILVKSYITICIFFLSSSGSPFCFEIENNFF